MTAQIIIFPNRNQYVHTLTEWAKQRNGRIRALPVSGGRGPMIVRLPADQKRTTVVCNQKKQGEFNMLRCVLEVGHTGPHCFVPNEKV